MLLPVPQAVTNICLDNNEIQARNNNAASVLFLNNVVVILMLAMAI
jgi:hypothetical protein